MVTHGHVVFKYKGIYYTFYNHSDSYFEHLGNFVVDEINKMINKDLVKHYKLLLSYIPLNGNEEGCTHIGTFHYLLKNPQSYQYFTSKKIAGCEYTYIIDFDSRKFIADKYNENIYSFNLYDIPLDWYEITQNNSSYEDNIELSEESSDSSEDEDYNETILKKIKKLEDAIDKLKLKLK